MAGFTELSTRSNRRNRRATDESPRIKWLLISLTVIVIALVLVLPLVVVLYEAGAHGWENIQKTFGEKYTQHAIGLTLFVASIAVPLNTIFGLCAAWAIARFQFRGREVLTSLIELPLWVSPVIGGLIYVLIFGQQGLFGPWFVKNMPIIFAKPGLVIATLFVTFPMVVRALIPLMEAQGAAEEEAALTLGANSWQIFWRVTLPKIKWGLLYGIILCNARAMGEFGAVYVVSNSVRGQTETMPLHIKGLYDDMEVSAAFAVAAALAMLALVTLVAKTYVEWRAQAQMEQSLAEDPIIEDPAMLMPGR